MINNIQTIFRQMIIDHYNNTSEDYYKDPQPINRQMNYYKEPIEQPILADITADILCFGILCYILNTL
tara:strand:+ start:5623 stop:5826 length:204 start_codon:yes stop_codon:yes gene_type:complete